MTPLYATPDYARVATRREAVITRLDELDRLQPASEEDALILAEWITAHFKVLEFGVYDAFPETQTPYRELMNTRWRAFVQEAMLPPAGKTSSVSKLFRKGLPVTASLRYIGQQMQRACATPNPTGTAAALRDICVASCLGTFKHVKIGWRERYRRWQMSPLRLYNEFMRFLKPQCIRIHIMAFVRGVINEDPLSHFLSTRNAPSYFHCAAMHATLQKVARVSRKRRGVPHAGFGLVVPPEHRSQMEAAVAFRGGAPPSAKRIRAGVTMTDSLRDAIMRQSSPDHARVPLTYTQKLQPTWAGKCTQGCGWLRRPIGGGGGAIVVDMEHDKPTCGTCGAPAEVALINNAQLQYGSEWARLCDGCGVFTSQWKLRGQGAVCQKCFLVPMPTGCLH